MKTKYYIVTICGCTDPNPLIGPFDAYKGMLDHARMIYSMQPEEDGLFYLVLTEGSAPRMESFSNLELE